MIVLCFHQETTSGCGDTLRRIYSLTQVIDFEVCLQSLIIELQQLTLYTVLSYMKFLSLFGSSLLGIAWISDKFTLRLASISEVFIIVVCINLRDLVHATKTKN